MKLTSYSFLFVTLNRQIVINTLLQKVSILYSRVVKHSRCEIFFQLEPCSENFSPSIVAPTYSYSEVTWSLELLFSLSLSFWMRPPGRGCPPVENRILKKSIEWKQKILSHSFVLRKKKPYLSPTSLPFHIGVVTRFRIFFRKLVLSVAYTSLWRYSYHYCTYYFL